MPVGARVAAIAVGVVLVLGVVFRFADAVRPLARRGADRQHLAPQVRRHRAVVEARRRAAALLLVARLLDQLVRHVRRGGAGPKRRARRALATPRLVVRQTARSPSGREMRRVQRVWTAQRATEDASGGSGGRRLAWFTVVVLALEPVRGSLRDREPHVRHGVVLRVRGHPRGTPCAGAPHVGPAAARRGAHRRTRVDAVLVLSLVAATGWRCSCRLALTLTRCA